jgi:hypothetical protein
MVQKAAFAAEKVPLAPESSGPDVDALAPAVGANASRDAGLDLSNNSLIFLVKGRQQQGDGGGASMARMRSLSDAVVARGEAANASTPIWSYAPDGARPDIRV